MDTHILHGDHQLPVKGRTFLESIVLVESHHLVVDCINQNRGKAANLRCFHCSQKGVFEKCSPDSTALHFLVHGETCEEHCGNGIVCGHCCLDCFWRSLLPDRAEYQRVIAHHHVVQVYNVCLR